jgi:hypothetical protein
MRKPNQTLRTLILALGCLCPVAGVAGAQSAKPSATTRGPAHAPNVLTAADARDGWQLLFDGKTLAGWHGLGFSTTPPGLWTVENGAIKHVEHGKGPVQADGQPLTGMDLISDRSFENFELAWEWKIAEAGNSGVKYNVAEALSTAMNPPHAAKGWEYQLIDDEKAEDTKVPSHRSGALYDMFAPNDRKHVNPAGQWNRSSIIFRGHHGEHWLNGEKVVEFDLGTAPFDSAFAGQQVQDVSVVVRRATERADRAAGPRRRGLVSGYQDS